MQWERVWSFEVWFRSAEASPFGTVYYQTHLRTSAGLRQWRQRALANPDVVNFKVKEVRQLVGDKPVRCPSGHPYYAGAWSMHYGRHDWRVCACGGHMIFHCDHPGCPTEWMLDPPLADGCAPVTHS